MPPTDYHRSEASGQERLPSSSRPGTNAWAHHVCQSWPGPCSSVGQSSRLVSGRSWVRIPPRALSRTVVNQQAVAVRVSIAPLPSRSHRAGSGQPRHLWMAADPFGPQEHRVYLLGAKHGVALHSVDAGGDAIGERPTAQPSVVVVMAGNDQGASSASWPGSMSVAARRSSQRG